jgi:hypothetical protein
MRLKDLFFPKDRLNQVRLGPNGIFCAKVLYKITYSVVLIECVVAFWYVNLKYYDHGYNAIGTTIILK